MSYELSQLRTLESEAIHIMREVAAEFERPVLLFSGGKDSIVMVRLGVLSVSPMCSSDIVRRNGWASMKCFGAPGTYCSLIAAIIAGEDWSAVRCM